MTQPSYVPIVEADQVRSAYRLRTPASWRPERVAELSEPAHPRGRGFGVPGPDQGYALLIAKRLFADKLTLDPGVSVDDALAGTCVVASARSAILGRAPVGKDIELALVLFGFVGSPPADLVAWRTPLFQGAHHNYRAQRRIVDLVPESTLRMTTDQIRDKLSEWRELVRS